MEPDQIDILAFAVLRDLEKVDHAFETRLSRQLWSDVRETDRQDRIHLDLTFFDSVAVTRLDARAHPDSDATGDLTATDSIAQALGEYHMQDSSGRSSLRTPSECGIVSAEHPHQLRRRRSPNGERETPRQMRLITALTGLRTRRRDTVRIEFGVAR